MGSVPFTQAKGRGAVCCGQNQEYSYAYETAVRQPVGLRGVGEGPGQQPIGGKTQE